MKFESSLLSYKPRTLQNKMILPNKSLQGIWGQPLFRRFLQFFIFISFSSHFLNSVEIPKPLNFAFGKVVILKQPKYREQRIP